MGGRGEAVAGGRRDREAEEDLVVEMAALVIWRLGWMGAGRQGGRE